jgi:rhamnosyl/mannosyltransferase
MKILYIDETYPPDIRGSVPYVSDLVKYFRENGDWVDVLTVGSHRRSIIEEGDHGCVIRMPCHLEFDSARFSFEFILFLLRKFNNYDIIHLNMPNPIGEVSFLFCHVINNRRGPKIVTTFHAEVVPQKKFAWLYNNLIARNVLAHSDCIVVSSPKLAETTKILAPYKKKLKIVPFGIDVLEWKRRAELAQMPPLPPLFNKSDTHHILFVGRLVRYKGVDVLLKAMTQAPGVLCIVGDGFLRKRIEELRVSLSLSNRVCLLGHISNYELAKMYEWADILVLPSVDRGEAFGYVLLEAMAQSTALITTELGTGTSWVNVNGETGLVVPPRDPYSLANAIRMICESPEILAKFKRNGLNRVLNFFTLEQMCLKTYEIYRSLLVS